MIATSQFTISVINDGQQGPQGVSVSKVVREYRLSDSSTSMTGSGTGYTWSETRPDIPAGKYLWERERTDLSNNTSTYSTAHCDITISGLVQDVDRNSGVITQKVWESYTQNSINEYDGSTGAAIRDRVTQTETDISGINTTISSVQSTLSTKADGSTVTTMQTQMNTISDTVSGHTQTITNINSRLDDDEDEISAVKSTAEQTADRFSWIVQDGSTSSSVQYTANALTAMANQIDLTGKVTFNSMNSALQNRLTTAESNASTAKTDASSAVSTANTASSNASTALNKVNNSIKSTTMHYLATSAGSGVTKSTSGWTTTIQTITATNKYLWTYQTITKIDDSTYDTDPVISGVYGNQGVPGNTGVSVTKVEQLYRTSNSTTAPAAPTSVVTSTSTTYNTWTLAMPTYNTSYPYYYTCTQTTYSDGNHTWTTPARSSAIEDANKTANTANTNATNAVNTANTANQNATTAVNTANAAKTKADSAASILSTWTGDATLATTTINGGYIKTHTIESEHLATDAIMSSNYTAIQGSHFSSTGSYLDLANGNFYTPNFGVSAASGSQGAYINGDVVASSGKIGSNDTNYWQIGNVYDYNATESAAIIGHGTSYIQSGNWQLSNNRLNTQYYSTTAASSGNLKYYKDSGTNTFYDVGVQIPTDFSATAPSNVAGRFAKSFFYGRKYTGNNAPTLDGNWTYFYLVDTSGNMYLAGDVYEGGTKLADKYALKTDVGSTYLPTAGGTVTGNLTVNGQTTLSGAVSTTLQLQTNLGSTSAATLTGNASAVIKSGVTGTLGVGNGGTGQTTAVNAANAFMNALTTGSSPPTDSDYYIAQYAGGGTTHTTFHRRPMSAMWTWIKGKIDSVYDITNTYRRLDDNNFDTLNATELNAGDLIVTGAGRFTNGLYGDLIGNAQTATSATTATTANAVGHTLKIQLNSGTSEDSNQFTYNGSATKTVNITKTSIGLGSVENTALSTWAGSSNLTTTKVGTLAAAATKGVDTSISAGSTSANLPTSNAVASFVEGKGYVTSSGVTSARVQATSPVVSSQNTAQSTTLNTTISLADGYGDTKNPYAAKTANYVLAGPSSGNAAAPSFRALVAADIPTLTKAKISDFPTTWALANVSGADDIKAIEGLTGTSGILKKKAANSWELTTVISSLSIDDDVITVTKSDGTTQELSVNVTGQIVTKATVLSASDGTAISQGSSSKPVYFSNGVPVEGNVIPTITLNNSGTTAPSFYAPTGAGTSGQYLKSNGSGAPTWATFSKSTVGLGNVDNTADANKAVLTATKFASAQSVTLTGDTTGTASSQAGWSIATKNVALSGLNSNWVPQSGTSARPTTANVNFHDNKVRYFLASSAMTEGKPVADAKILHLAWDNSGYDSQLALTTSNILQARGANYSGTFGDWVTFLSSDNYNTYSPKLDGTGATGTWGISITGNATTATSATTATKATQDGNGSVIASTYLKLSGGTLTGSLITKGTDIILGATGVGSAPNDSGDLVWQYGTGTEKMRLWSPNDPTVKQGPNYRLYDANGTSLYSGTLPLADGTGATGTWGISITGTAAKATADASGNTISSTYLKLSGGTMTGILNLPYNKQSISFRHDNASYDSGFVYGTSGNEALALVQQNAVTSFMVVHGSDPASWSSASWNSSSPTIQTKNKSLYVNELITSGTTPAYNFKVNGTSYLGGEVRISNSNADTESVSMMYDADLDCLNFIFN